MMTQSTRHERKKERNWVKCQSPGGTTLFRSFSFPRTISRILFKRYTHLLYMLYSMVGYLYTVRQQRYTYFALLWLLFGSLGSQPTSSRSDTYRTSQNSSSSLCCYLRQIQRNLSFFRPHIHTHHTAE